MANNNDKEKKSNLGEGFEYNNQALASSLGTLGTWGNDLIGTYQQGKRLVDAQQPIDYSDVKNNQNLLDSYNMDNFQDIQHLSGGDYAKNIGGSALQGAAAGAQFGWIGALAGAGLGGLKGLTQSWMSEHYNDEAEEVQSRARAEQANNFYDTANQNNQRELRSNMYTQFAEGGMMDNGVNQFNNGGTHESNPYNGIPQGIASDGNPNLVEEGEVRVNDNIYSNRVKLTATALQHNNLSVKYAGKTAAEVMMKYQKESEERPNDGISLDTKDEFADRVFNAQEEVKLDMQRKQFTKMLASMTPEQQQMMMQAAMQSAQPYPQEEAPATPEEVMQGNPMGIEEEQPIMAKGGNIHIKKSHEGLFTKQANNAGMSVQTFASHVLANKDKFSPDTVRRANFAKNASSWQHAYGGNIGGNDNDNEQVQEQNINGNNTDRNKPSKGYKKIKSSDPMYKTFSHMYGKKNVFKKGDEYLCIEDGKEVIFKKYADKNGNKNSNYYVGEQQQGDDTHKYYVHESSFDKNQKPGTESYHPIIETITKEHSNGTRETTLFIDDEPVKNEMVLPNGGMQRINYKTNSGIPEYTRYDEKGEIIEIGDWDEKKKGVNYGYIPRLREEDLAGKSKNSATDEPVVDHRTIEEALNEVVNKENTSKSTGSTANSTSAESKTVESQTPAVNENVAKPETETKTEPSQSTTASEENNDTNSSDTTPVIEEGQQDNTSENKDGKNNEEYEDEEYEDEEVDYGTRDKYEPANPAFKGTYYAWNKPNDWQEYEYYLNEEALPGKEQYHDDTNFMNVIVPGMDGTYSYAEGLADWLDSLTPEEFEKIKTDLGLEDLTRKDVEAFRRYGQDAINNGTLNPKNLERTHALINALRVRQKNAAPETPTNEPTTNTPQNEPTVEPGGAIFKYRVDLGNGTYIDVPYTPDWWKSDQVTPDISGDVKTYTYPANIINQYQFRDENGKDIANPTGFNPDEADSWLNANTSRYRRGNTVQGEYNPETGEITNTTYIDTLGKENRPARFNRNQLGFLAQALASSLTPTNYEWSDRMRGYANSFKPIAAPSLGGYRQYRPYDANIANNEAMAQNASMLNSIRNSNTNSATQLAQALAANSQYQRDYAARNLAMQQANEQNRLATDTYNLGIDKTNLDLARAYDAMNQQTNAQRVAQLNAAEQMGEGLETATSKANSAAWSQALTNMYKAGKEQNAFDLVGTAIKRNQSKYTPDELQAFREIGISI